MARPPVGRPPFGSGGGPPPRAVPGTDRTLLAHPVPTAELDPSNFVGPDATLSPPKAVAAIRHAGPAAGVIGEGPMTPAAVAAAATEAGAAGAHALLAPLVEAFRRNSPLSGRVSGTLPLVGLDQYFLRRLPAQGLQIWHRKRAVRGTTAIVAGTTFRLLVDTLPRGVAVVIMKVKQYWYDAGLDPLDPDALTGFQDNQAAYGRVAFNLLANNQPLFDAFEDLVDPNGGAFTARRVQGFTELNQNLLFVGEHPTAIYVQDGYPITATWTTGALLPAHVPTTVAVELQGYTVPMKLLREILINVRQPG